ncbi:D-aspartate oxidase-like isoform X2 [Ostrea edulis]|nr:D-aspartate oxidase-like isoform X2 [Ostrea edulis]XP_048762322.2 D-aspartate oxidase-like isoform X2 [Ostrea edulis]XP_048762323.2 D-aspartate oxidase-like isoform X2 [Ostrea edulis]
MKKPRVCVVGAGVIGLSTAVRIQNELPNYDVTVLADRFSPDTTSDGSGGFWQPHLVGGDNQDMVIQWGRDTLNYLFYLATSPLANRLGAQMVSGYSFFSEPQCPEWRHLVLGYREVDSREIKLLFPRARFGMFYTTVMIHVKAYLSWLMSRFKHNNGNVIDARIDKLEDLVKEYDVIVNCTGLGARKLINDHDVTPIRGQVTRVKAPWVKLFMTYQGTHGHCENYILPGADAVVLGGTGQEGNWNTGVDDEDRKMILEGCVEMMPSLKEAEVVRHWTGLRPHRTSGVRLETERLAKGKLVVHNYGHGGAGVTLHWGCAGQVVREIRTAFTPNFSRL